MNQHRAKNTFRQRCTNLNLLQGRTCCRDMRSVVSWQFQLLASPASISVSNSGYVVLSNDWSRQWWTRAHSSGHGLQPLNKSWCKGLLHYFYTMADACERLFALGCQIGSAPPTQVFILFLSQMLFSSKNLHFWLHLRDYFWEYSNWDTYNGELQMSSGTESKSALILVCWE